MDRTLLDKNEKEEEEISERICYFLIEQKHRNDAEYT